MSRINVGVNYGRSCETWWESGGLELWKFFTGHFFYVLPGKVVDRVTADRFRKDAERIPGWNEGPLTFTEID